MNDCAGHWHPRVLYVRVHTAASVCRPSAIRGGGRGLAAVRAGQGASASPGAVPNAAWARGLKGRSARGAVPVAQCQVGFPGLRSGRAGGPDPRLGPGHPDPAPVIGHSNLASGYGLGGDILDGMFPAQFPTASQSGYRVRSVDMYSQ